MAIRIREVNGVTVALCGARSVPKEGDLYLDDNAHYALTVKFMRDLDQLYEVPPREESQEDIIMDAEESNNQNRDIWDKTYGVESAQ